MILELVTRPYFHVYVYSGAATMVVIALCLQKLYFQGRPLWSFLYVSTETVYSRMATLVIVAMVEYAGLSFVLSTKVVPTGTATLVVVAECL